MKTFIPIQRPLLIAALIVIILACGGSFASEPPYAVGEKRQACGEYTWHCGPCNRFPMLGSHPYVWILLRFADNDTTPRPREWFERQALGDYPSLDHYWREQSFNTMNIEGSVVVGWFDLPQPRSYYFPYPDTICCERAIDDAIEQADPEVDFSQFSGINLIYNSETVNAGVGGTVVYTVDGAVDKCFGVTWCNHNTWITHAIIAHEMGHSLGLEYHSSGPYGEIYDSKWDVMSDKGGTWHIQDPVYGILGQHTIAAFKNELGWIHPLHRYEMSFAPTITQVTLHDLATVPPNGQLLLAKINWPSIPMRYYTFERRCWTGYDRNVPGEAVVIHAVHFNEWEEPAHVVDPDGNHDPNDDSAMWTPCETFADELNGIVATVESADDHSSLVTLSNAGRYTVYVDGAYSGPEDGSPLSPWNTVWEGHCTVFPGGNVMIEPGSYPETLRLCKPAVLRRSGSSGTVVIGS